MVDGYFRHRPAVWHEEILWAISQGIHVFGAASMGAIRATELSAFGMQGVGRIFEMFHGGQLRGDDEVAVAHASEEQGFRPLSDAMVNIRLTLAAAASEGVIGDETRLLLERRTKASPYFERSLRAALRAARSEVPDRDLAELESWLPTGMIDQKRLDALEMVRTMAECSRAGWQPRPVTFEFARTEAWERLMSRVVNASPVGGTIVDLDALVEELLVRGGAVEAFQGAAARALSLEGARHVKVDRLAVDAISEEFRMERGLSSAEDFQRWADEQELPGQKLDRFFEREALVRRAHLLSRTAIHGQLADHAASMWALRRSGSESESEAHSARGAGSELPRLWRRLSSRRSNCGSGSSSRCSGSPCRSMCTTSL